METGYESRFDFPRRESSPAIPYLLASVPRTGSTFVSHLLWQTGCLGSPLEYLNFEQGSPYGFAHGNPLRQNEVWRNAVRTRTSPNGVFGLKLFPGQMHVLTQENPGLVRQVMLEMLPGRGRNRLVRLRRRDRTAHAISYARALLSGVWRSEQEGSGNAEPSFSSEALEHANHLIEVQESAWDHMLADMKFPALDLWYEDIRENPDRTASDVAEYLGVSLLAECRVTVPEVRRQSQAGASEWRSALDRTGNS